jgi:hypothetical protein
LGLDPRDCNENTIIRNSHICATPVKDVLKDMGKVTSQYREHRNRFVHRGQNPALDNLDKIEQLLFYYDNDLIPEDMKHKVKRDQLENRHRGERQRLTKDLRAQTGIIVEALETLFDDLVCFLTY